MNSFLRQAVWTYRSRYAFTFNVYPYFDPNLQPGGSEKKAFDLSPRHLNPGSQSNCSSALQRATCWDGPTCLGPAIMTAARRKMQQLTGRRGGNKRGGIKGAKARRPLLDWRNRLVVAPGQCVAHGDEELRGVFEPRMGTRHVFSGYRIFQAVIEECESL